MLSNLSKISLVPIKTVKMAIQKAVDEKMARPDLIQETDKIYAYIGGDYARAWEIVKTEGSDPFLSELKAWNSK